MDRLESPTELAGDLPITFPNTPLQAAFGDEPINYDDEYVKLNSKYQMAWTESLGTGAFSNSTTYERTEVLMLSWDPKHDDLKVQDEVAKLTQVFEEKFNYHVTPKRLERNEMRSTQVQVNKIVADWVHEYDAYKTLLIVYFAGHGRQSKNGGLELSGQSSPSDLCDYFDRVAWNITENFLLELRADVLQIFDCCFAGTIEARGRRVASEFLAATKDGYTARPGKESFTTALIWALNELVVEKRRFTTGDLSNKIREAPDYPRDQKPYLVRRGGNAFTGRQLIILQPLCDVPARSLAVDYQLEDVERNENSGGDVVTLKIFFTTRLEEMELRLLAKDLGHVIGRNELKVNRIDFAGIQPRKSEVMYQVITRLRGILARRRSRGQTAAVTADLIKSIETKVEEHVLERIEAKPARPWSAMLTDSRLSVPGFALVLIFALGFARFRK